MPDPIAPPVAHQAEEALELVCQAFSDGDIEAAFAQYEDSAQLRPWAAQSRDHDWRDIRAVLGELMGLRLPLSAQVSEVLQISDLSVVMCERRIFGTGPDCEPVRLRGYGFTAVRPQPDGTWLIVADAWCLEPVPGSPAAVPLDPPEIPPGTRADAVQGEGPGRANLSQ
jgi:hypothetical protein